MLLVDRLWDCRRRLRLLPAAVLRASVLELAVRGCSSDAPFACAAGYASSHRARPPRSRSFETCEAESGEVNPQVEDQTPRLSYDSAIRISLFVGGPLNGGLPQGDQCAALRK